MKSKATTYLLGAVVAIVWGLIIYRVLSASNGDDDAPAETATATITHKEPLNDYALTKDTARLMLNYRDPFAMEKPKDTAKIIPLHRIISSSIKPAAVAAPIYVKPAINWNFISYTGFIRNPTSKKLLALVHINGQEVMLNEGEAAGGVKLLKNLRDSIKIAYQGKTKYIIMNSNTL